MKKTSGSGNTAVPLIEPVQIESSVEDIDFKDEEEKDCTGSMEWTSILRIDSLSCHTHAENPKEHEVLVDYRHLREGTFLGLLIDPSPNYDEK